MCGLAGMVTTRRGAVTAALQRAENVLRHRGPDGQGMGLHAVAAWTVGLAHQRLAILDLSPGGDQPMTAGGSVLVYNGEVYNYRELRRELLDLGHFFQGGSDTEVVLAALRQWGPTGAMARFNGMWALAWLDPANRRLVLARDRLGVKPLHYTLTAEGELLFASEIKGILAMNDGRYPLNLQAAGEFLLQSLAHRQDETLFRGIWRLPAGHWAEVDLDSERLRVAPAPYWRLPPPLTAMPPEASLIEEVRTLFLDAVRLRLRSDVPVGVLLSGGVDSGAIACAMDHLLGREADLNLLSAVSLDPRFDESPFIDQVASHLGRPVHRVVLDFSPAVAMELLAEATWFHESPLGSFSNVAHYLLMARAKALGITVVLSGQGADELLCGYRKYLGFYLQHLALVGDYARLVSTAWSFWRNGTIFSQFTFREAKRYLPAWMREVAGDWVGPALRGEGGLVYRPVPMGLGRGQTVPERQGEDLRQFSIPPLTHYEDRSSMAWSREIRLPFLDVRLVERLAPLPVACKLAHGWTKYLFRQAMAPLMPKAVVWRKDKQGFINPQGEWLKGPLREQVMAFFSPDGKIFQYGLVDRDRLLLQYERYCRQPPDGGLISFNNILNPLAMEIWLRRFDHHLSGAV